MGENAGFVADVNDLRAQGDVARVRGRGRIPVIGASGHLAAGDDGVLAQRDRAVERLDRHVAEPAAADETCDRNVLADVEDQRVGGAVVVADDVDERGTSRVRQRLIADDDDVARGRGHEVGRRRRVGRERAEGDRGGSAGLRVVGGGVTQVWELRLNRPDGERIGVVEQEAVELDEIVAVWILRLQRDGLGGQRDVGKPRRVVDRVAPQDLVELVVEERPLPLWRHGGAGQVRPVGQ